MNLQTTFYIMGIIYMTLNIIILISIGVALFIVAKKVFEIQRHIAEAIEAITSIARHPQDLAADMGATAAASAYNKVKSLFRSGKNKGAD